MLSRPPASCLSALATSLQNTVHIVIVINVTFIRVRSCAMYSIYISSSKPKMVWLHYSHSYLPTRLTSTMRKHPRIRMLTHTTTTTMTTTTTTPPLETFYYLDIIINLHFAHYHSITISLHQYNVMFMRI